MSILGYTPTPWYTDDGILVISVYAFLLNADSFAISFSIIIKRHEPLQNYVIMSLCSANNKNIAGACAHQRLIIWFFIP